MASSKTEIANLALVHLGQPTILSFDDASRAAGVAKATYDLLRDAVLRAHPWNFATTRAQLSADATSPIAYSFSYTLPPDCLRVLRVNQLTAAGWDWVVEGRQVLTDLEAPIEALYIRQALDVGHYDPLFVEALAARLAMDWAEPLARSTTLMQSMAILYKAKIQEARTIDGQEGTQEIIEANLWIDSRL